MQWVIFKKVGWFRWEFVQYFPEVQYMVHKPDIYHQLIMLSEMDNMRPYRACILGEVSYIQTKVKVELTPMGIIKSVIVKA